MIIIMLFIIKTKEYNKIIEILRCTKLNVNNEHSE